VGCGCGGKGFSQTYATGMRSAPASHVPSQRPVNVQQSKSLQERGQVQTSVGQRRKV
jgi:hypothetical protein